MLTGENGIITQAQNSKEATEQARVEELVDLAVNSLIGENQGSTNGITPEMIAEEVNEMESREDIYAEGSTFPTNIIFPEEGRKVDVNLMQKNENTGDKTNEISENSISNTINTSTQDEPNDNVFFIYFMAAPETFFQVSKFFFPRHTDKFPQRVRCCCTDGSSAYDPDALQKKGMSLSADFR